MSDWKPVTSRNTADVGAVWYSPSQGLYKRTGGPEVETEGHHQRLLADLGFPVPRPDEVGFTEEEHYFTEPEVGARSLHELAVEQAAKGDGRVQDTLIDTAVRISSTLLRAQAAHPFENTKAGTREWLWRAGFVDEVFSQNPDLDTEEVRGLLDSAVERLHRLPLCHGHLDYGLPNAFPDSVIDWQHHALAPLGSDVCAMLDIAAFKGGKMGYAFTPEQRSHYLKAMDEVAQECVGMDLSPYQGDFLLAKCFFFLSRTRPESGSGPAQHRKWRYRRTLFGMATGQYAATREIDTAVFPSLAEFDRSSKEGTSERPGE